jgi:hypothetical protein
MRLLSIFLIYLEVVLFSVDRCSCLSAENQLSRAAPGSRAVSGGNDNVSPRMMPSRAEAALPSRRRWLCLIASGTAAVNAWTFGPSTALARYVLDEETGDYVEVDETDWQTAWKQRLDKASTMSMDEIVQAARGAGNVELKATRLMQAVKRTVQQEYLLEKSTLC